MSCGSTRSTGCCSGTCGCTTPRGETVDDSRRAFLRGAAAAAGTTLAAGGTLYSFGAEPAVARAPGEKVTSKVRWGLLIDASKCGDGCTACVTACQTENGWHDSGDPETDAQWIRKLAVKNPKNGATFSLPMMCQHCADAPCVDVCRTGAPFN